VCSKSICIFVFIPQPQVHWIPWVHSISDLNDHMLLSTAMYCQTCLFLLAKTSWPLQLFLLAFKFLVKSFYLIGVFFFIMIHSCFIFDAHLECTEWSSTIILNQMFSNFFLHVFSSFIHCQYLHILRKQLCPLNS
jgi:hypothetical protein